MYRTTHTAREGFTLVELLVYVALLSWFSYMVCPLMIGMVHSVREGGQTAAVAAQALLAFDLVVRDLRVAPATVHAWKKMPSSYQEEAELIWTTQSEGDIGWSVHKGKLVRTTGSYDAQEKRWRSKRTVAAAHAVQKFRASVMHKNNRVNIVQCALELDHAQVGTLEQRVVLRTGAVA